MKTPPGGRWSRWSGCWKSFESMTSSGPVHFVDFLPAHADELVRMWRASFERAVGVTDPSSVGDSTGLPRQGRGTPSPGASRFPVGHDRWFCGSQSRVDWAAVCACGPPAPGHRYNPAGVGQAAIRRQPVAVYLRRQHRCAAILRTPRLPHRRPRFEANWQLDDIKYEWRAE